MSIIIFCTKKHSSIYRTSRQQRSCYRINFLLGNHRTVTFGVNVVKIIKSGRLSIILEPPLRRIQSDRVNPNPLPQYKGLCRQPCCGPLLREKVLQTQGSSSLVQGFQSYLIGGQGLSAKVLCLLNIQKVPLRCSLAPSITAIVSAVVDFPKPRDHMATKKGLGRTFKLLPMPTRRLLCAAGRRVWKMLRYIPLNPLKGASGARGSRPLSSLNPVSLCSFVCLTASAPIKSEIGNGNSLSQNAL